MRRRTGPSRMPLGTNGAHRKPLILCRRVSVGLVVAVANDEFTPSFGATFPNLAFLACHSVTFLRALGRIDDSIVAPSLQVV